MKQKIDHFSTEHLIGNLRERTIQGTKQAFSAQFFQFLLQIASITILARLLQPEDFGLIAMVTILSALFSSVTEGGLSTATVQWPELTQNQVSNLFWTNCIIGLSLTATFIVATPILVWFFDEPRLEAIALALSVSFSIQAVGIQSKALLRRRMRFGIIALINITSTAIGTFTAISLALSGFGYWALVAMPIVTTSCQSVLAAALCSWMPSLPRRHTGVRPMLWFGANITMANFIGSLQTSLTPFLLGRMGGADVLGFFNRANTITSIPNTQVFPPVMAVAHPALSRVWGDDQRFRSASLQLLQRVSLVAMFITVLTLLFADWIVFLFLGSGWSDSVIFVKLLSIGVLVQPVVNTIAASLLAAGKANTLLTVKVCQLCLTATAVMIGQFWGAVGIVAAFALSGVFMRLPVFIWLATRVLPFALSDFSRAFLPVLSMGAILAVGLLFFRSIIGDVNVLLGLLLGLFTSVPLYILSGLMFGSIRAEISDMAKSILCGRKPPQNARGKDDVEDKE